MLPRSFADELLKIARDVSTHRGFQKQLEPGDIVLSSFGTVSMPEGVLGGRAKPAQRAGWKAFRQLSEKFQGPLHEHSAIYVGKGRVVETGPPKGAREMPLSKMTGSLGQLTAVRPDVDARERSRAAKRARGLIGTKYSIPRLGRAGLANFVKLKPEKVSDRRKHEYICSTLVGDSYDRVGFNPRKPNDALMPADFFRSDRTEVVARRIPK